LKHGHYLLLILALAAGLRLYGLTEESLWLDEGFTARRAHYTAGELVNEFSHDTQTALYYFAINGWCRLFGTSEFALRFPSVLLGILTVFGTYLLARELFSSTAGLFSALVMAINPFAIFYSQEARPYALFLAASVFAVYFALRVFRSPDRGPAIGLVLSTAITLCVHPLGMMLLPVLTAMWLMYSRLPGFESARHHPWKILGLGVAAFLLYLPQVVLMWRTMINKTHGNSPMTSWIPIPTLTVFRDSLYQFFMTREAALIALSIVIAVLVWRIRKDRSDWPGLSLQALIVVGFMIGPYVISHVLSPVYVHRYVIPALTACVIALGWALSKLRIPWRVAAMVVFIALSTRALYGYYAGRDKEDWREAAAFVAENARPGDMVVLHPRWLKDAFGYYFRPPAGVEVTYPLVEDEIPSSVDSAAHLWLVQCDGYRSTRLFPALSARIAEHRTADATAYSTRRPANPHAFWAPVVRVSLWTRR
jgi:mannosyltransferase